MADLTTDVKSIRGIGEKRAKALAKLGIYSLRDLLYWFPRAYEDRRKSVRIEDLVPEEHACVTAMVASEPTLSHLRRGLDLVKCRVVDESGSLDLTFFNQVWMKNHLRLGETYIFYGKAEGSLLRHKMVNPLVEQPERQELTGCIMPIYRLTAGISQLNLTRSVRQGLDVCRNILPDVLPDGVRQDHELCHIGFAYENVHFPTSEETLQLARRRLVFEELFLFTLGLGLLKNRRETVNVPACHAVNLTPFYDSLSFTLTGAQQRSIDDAIRDMCSGKPMNRLCQGDVGSGKTMVAVACLYFMVQNGKQGAMMAPTEILAKQHHQGLTELLEPLGVRCGLLTGSMTTKQKRMVRTLLETGDIDCIIGTHALLSEGVTYLDLGLVVTDEQHRFGVNQRAALSQKGLHPHVFVMSATPIPRTLALILYGDLDVSVIDELPPGRQKIETYAVSSSYRPRIYNFLRKLVSEGRQAYIVCSLVSENGDLPDERKAVNEYAKTLRETVFPNLRVGVVHGKLKQKEKDTAMTAFVNGDTDILVSTTVIEVGVDVPNAAVMVIENAERFGLSQLHQLRGRVGRGEHQSYCILISDNGSEDTKARLRVMTQTGDGFKIAEEDLKLRGPGDFFGERQHGLPGLKIADLACDLPLLQEAQQAAEQLLESDPDLQNYPPTRKRVQELFNQNADTLN